MMKPSKLSNNARSRAQRKDIELIAFAVIDAGHPIGANESLILSVLRNLSIKCSESELRRALCCIEDKGIIRLARVDGAPWTARRLAGPATGIAGGDVHTAARTVAEAPPGARPRPAGKAVRADSRRSKRVSR
jgi:hypothetical protein